jgi:hypothetical protein
MKSQIRQMILLAAAVVLGFVISVAIYWKTDMYQDCTRFGSHGVYCDFGNMAYQDLCSGVPLKRASSDGPDDIPLSTYIVGGAPFVSRVQSEYDAVDCGESLPTPTLRNAVFSMGHSWQFYANWLAWSLPFLLATLYLHVRHRPAPGKET